MIWIRKFTKLGINKPSLGFSGPLPAQGLSRENSTVRFQLVLSLVFDEFLDYSIDILQLLPFFEAHSVFPRATPVSHAHFYEDLGSLIDVLRQPCWWGTWQAGQSRCVGAMKWMEVTWERVFFYSRLQPQKPPTKNRWLPTAEIWADATVEMYENRTKNKTYPTPLSNFLFLARRNSFLTSQAKEEAKKKQWVLS